MTTFNNVGSMVLFEIKETASDKKAPFKTNSTVVATGTLSTGIATVRVESQTGTPAMTSTSSAHSHSHSPIVRAADEDKPPMEYAKPKLERDLGTIRVTFDKRVKEKVPYNMDGEMEGVAMTMISMGTSATNTVQLERCISTVRNNGGWGGPIFIITDGMYPRYQEVTTMYPNTFMIVVGKSLFNNEMTGFFRKLKFKRFKTQLNDFITSFDTSVTIANYTDETILNSDVISPIETIVYMDMDIVMAASIDPFLHFIHHLKVKVRDFIENEQQVCASNTRNAKTERKTPSYAIMFQDISSPLHSGVFVTDTKESNDCLALWRELMDKRELAYDQQTLKQLIELGSPPCDQRCAMVRMERWKEFFIFPTKKFMENGQLAPFVHITNNARAKSIPEEVQIDYFNNTLGLPVELYGVGTF